MPLRIAAHCLQRGHGLVEPGEDERSAALRETLEEAGLKVEIVSELGTVRQKSGKIVHAFAATVVPESEGDIDERGRCRNPDGENDVCRFYPIVTARELMIPEQRELLDRLEKPKP